MKREWLLGIAVLTIMSASAQSRRDKEQTYKMESPYETVVVKPVKGKKVKNVILMIGDGMSLMHQYSAWSANGGKLNLENCPVVGLSKTYCTNKLITDSGAAGTAMATGQKTNYHSVGVDVNGTALPSLTDFAQDKGLATGIVVTCRLNDATPAAFCANSADRDDAEKIAADYVNCGVDFVFGGGRKHFLQREDNRNLVTELQSKGYQTPYSWDELEKIKNGKVFALVDTLDLQKPKERGDILGDASMKAIDMLSKNKKGFFMMIEGSQLDDYGHFNDLDLLMQEVHDFDRTIGRVLQWAEQDGETLVIVTADHETGGLTLVNGDKNQNTIVGKFSTGGHSGVMVPVYAYGPMADQFTGIYENTAIFDKIKKLLKL